MKLNELKEHVPETLAKHIARVSDAYGEQAWHAALKRDSNIKSAKAFQMAVYARLLIEQLEELVGALSQEIDEPRAMWREVSILDNWTHLGYPREDEGYFYIERSGIRVEGNEAVWGTAKFKKGEGNVLFRATDEVIEKRKSIKECSYWIYEEI